MAPAGVDAEKALKPLSDDDDSPIEEVRLTVSNEDDPTLPVWTFRMWFLGLLSCVLLSFLNTFFSYRSEPLVISMISVQVATLPVGRFMANVLPATKFRLPGFGSREFSLNPGPFNMKEHVLISIFANAGSAFGGGTAYAVGIVNIVKAFYKRNISFWASVLLVITTQVLGYGWAGIMRKYVIEPAEMWWPSSLVQVSLFRALHEEDRSKYSRERFFVIAATCSFCCPLVTPFFSIVNVAVGYFGVVYVLIPIVYWVFNVYDVKTFPLFSMDLYNSHGQLYNVSAIVNDRFEIDLPAYQANGHVKLNVFLLIAYGLNFAGVVATITHVALFNGKEIYQRYRASYKGKDDIHTRLMKNYKDIPDWWFHGLLVLSLAVSLALCVFMKDQVQLPWWGLLFAAAMAMLFTLPISIITATTNQTPGLNVITEYLMGMIYPGRPIANVCFKTFGYISMAQAVSFLNDFKLGHYLKIPPRSMFIVQFIGTMIAGLINTGVAWYLLTSIQNICDEQLLPPDSPWTCPNDHLFYIASVIWGLVGPKRIFGSLGDYAALNWFFLGGAVAPMLVWLLHKAFPKQSWIKLINLPVLLGATAMMPPASTINFNSWIVVGTVFNFFVFRYRKRWWQRYNYVLSAALDAGLAFMAVLLYFALGMENVGVEWWGKDEHCPLAACPTARGVAVDGCPIF
ncbi:oligopeptide transporter 4 [Perilla frutescens var. hirtella]|nr:oligopeptide transporter 4 [Perilla frutescens var. hirtella]